MPEPPGREELLRKAVSVTTVRLLITFFAPGLFCVPATAYAATTSTAPIAEIHVERKDVFDPSVPGEDIWPFRAANAVHIHTREEVVRHELLQAPGQAYDPLRALETERNLRSLGFIRRAEVRPLPRPDGRLDLSVLTQDSWTLQPQLNVGTEGGDHYFIYGIQEGNLLGRGKSASVFHAQVGGDARNELRYSDPRVLRTWFQGTSLYTTTPRGDEIGLLLERPFYSYATLYSARLAWARIIQEDALYQDADETSKFIQNYRTIQASQGLLVRGGEDLVQRVHGGVHHEKNSFFQTVDTAAGSLPENRTLTGPWLGYSLVQPRYIKETDVDSMQRVEDFNLGNEFGTMAGPMLASWGSDRDRWLFSASDQQGLGLGEGRFGLGQAGVVGRIADGRLENTLFFANLNVFWKARWPLRQTWVGHLELNSAERLDRENQLVLGGNTGLRGYKNESFTGGRSVLLNVEDRVFCPREFLHLFYFGGAVFLETGAVAPQGAPITRDRFHSDIGAGLRISSSRSTRGGVIRLDLAYALNGGPGGSRWVVSLRGGQAFSIFNSSNRNVLRNPDAALGEDSEGVRLRKR